MKTSEGCSYNYIPSLYTADCFGHCDFAIISASEKKEEKKINERHTTQLNLRINLTFICQSNKHKDDKFRQVLCANAKKYKKPID